MAAAGAGQFANPGGSFKLGEVVGTGASGVLTIALPGGYRDIEIEVVGRSDTAATSAAVTATFNGDVTVGDYWDEVVFGNVATASAAENAGAAAGLGCGNVPAGTSTANLYGSIKLWLPEYANTGLFKVIHALPAGVSNLASGGILTQTRSGIVKLTAAITTVTLTLAAGNWTTTSRATVRGVY